MSEKSGSVRESSSSKSSSRLHRSSSARREKSNNASYIYKRSNRLSVQEALQNAESQIEKAIVESENPIRVHNVEEVIINDEEKGYWLNKEEVDNWQGPVPLEEYRLNEDPSPIVVKKKPSEKLKYKQEVHIKYLKPPTPKPAEILVIQEPDKQLPPAPPLVIRTAPSPVPSPEPIIIREAPPPSPCPAQRKVIYVPGKVLPPPARKVIYEKLPEYPQKPQKIIIERWLQAKQPKPKIIFCKQVDTQPRCQPMPCPPPLPTCLPSCPPQCPPCQPCDYQTSYTSYQNCLPVTSYTTTSFDPQVNFGSPGHRAHYNNDSGRREYVYDIYL